jgi:hypothetical protein
MVAIGYSDELMEGYCESIVDSFTVIVANLTGRRSASSEPISTFLNKF